MSLVLLPNEILFSIAGLLEYCWHINSFVQVSRHLLTSLNPYLYYFDSSALRWAAKHGKEVTARQFLSLTTLEESENILSTLISQGLDVVLNNYGETCLNEVINKKHTLGLALLLKKVQTLYSGTKRRNSIVNGSK